MTLLSTLLIENEKKYLEKLELIDSKLAPPWMKQFESAAPDFTELLKCIQDIISVNKPFYEKLLNGDLSLDDNSILLDLINGLSSSAYKSYSENIIHNLNKRQDIVCTLSIQEFLNDESNKDITLESLFYAPLYQLNFYKSLFNKPDITIHQTTLTKANQLLDSLMINNSLPSVDLDTFFSQLDYTKVVDILNEKHIPNYTLPTLQKILFCHSFVCTDLSKRLKLILTADLLIFCAQDINKKDYLLYTPVSIEHISIRTIHSDRELIGEYHMQIWVQKQKLFTLKSKSKQERNMWLGQDENTKVSSSSWLPLLDVVQKYHVRHQSMTPKFKASAPKPIRTTDIFTVFTDNSDTISPLVSSDEEEEPVVSVTKPLPQVPPHREHHPAATRSLPVRNHSLKKPPIPSEFAFVSSPEAMTKAPPRPPHMRSLSSSQLPQHPQPQAVVKKSSFMKSVMSSLKPHKKSSVESFSTTSTQSPPLRHNQSTPSFTSIQTSSQSSLNMTPPLSRSSSPGSNRFSRYQSTSSSSSEDFGNSPPESPEVTNYYRNTTNTIKQVLYSNDQCQVFHWKDESWYAVEEACVLEVRQTNQLRSCVTVHMRQTGQFYLNAWVLPDTAIARTNPTDINVTIHGGENYLFHFDSATDADQLQTVLQQQKADASTMTLRGAPPPVLARSSSLAANNTLTPEELSKTLKLAMQCKCKLYVQSASSKWSSFGSVSMQVSQQYATKKMHMAMESTHKKKQLVSAMVQSNNVERLGTKRISFLLSDDVYSVVYMIQVREETTADKIMEYLKFKNAENGW